MIDQVGFRIRLGEVGPQSRFASFPAQRSSLVLDRSQDNTPSRDRARYVQTSQVKPAWSLEPAWSNQLGQTSTVSLVKTSLIKPARSARSNQPGQTSLVKLGRKCNEVSRSVRDFRPSRPDYVQNLQLQRNYTGMQNIFDFSPPNLFCTQCPIQIFIEPFEIQMSSSLLQNFLVHINESQLMLFTLFAVFSKCIEVGCSRHDICEH